MTWVEAFECVEREKSECSQKYKEKYNETDQHRLLNWRQAHSNKRKKRRKKSCVKGRKKWAVHKFTLMCSPSNVSSYAWLPKYSFLCAADSPSDSYKLTDSVQDLRYREASECSRKCFLRSYLYSDSVGNVIEKNKREREKENPQPSWIIFISSSIFSLKLYFFFCVLMCSHPEPYAGVWNIQSQEWGEDRTWRRRRRKKKKWNKIIFRGCIPWTHRPERSYNLITIIVLRPST